MQGEQVERVASISAHRAKSFIKKLGKYPFVALVIEGDEIVVYAKGIDEHRELLGELLGELTG